MIDIYGGYVYKKNIDWSVLHEGISIPVTIQKKFTEQADGFLDRGQKKDVNLVLNGRTYKAQIKNQLFDSSKYKRSTDIVQIRYNPSSEIAVELRKIYYKSYQYLREQRKIAEQMGQRIQVKLPENFKEEIALYLTDYPETYVVECLTAEDYSIIKQSFIKESEQDYENSINHNLTDDSASIEEKLQLVKIRRINRAIGECLKELYQYKCQICGENISARYNVEIVETHHIIPFIYSLDNDASNQIILCPNHHRIIHKAEPEFKRSKMLFVYKNGIIEKVPLNFHL